MDEVCSMGCRACIYTLFHGSIKYGEIYFLDSGHQSHAQPQITAQRKSLCTILVVLSLTSARTFTHHMEKELTLCCINLTTNCCVLLPFIVCYKKNITADHAGSCGDICMVIPKGGWVGTRKVTHVFFFLPTRK